MLFQCYGIFFGVVAYWAIYKFLLSKSTWVPGMRNHIRFFCEFFITAFCFIFTLYIFIWIFHFVKKWTVSIFRFETKGSNGEKIRWFISLITSDQFLNNSPWIWKTEILRFFELRTHTGNFGHGRGTSEMDGKHRTRTVNSGHGWEIAETDEITAG